MLEIRRHIVFLLVIVATGATMALAGPASLQAVAVVFLGLFAVHLNGLRASDWGSTEAPGDRAPSGRPSPGGSRKFKSTGEFSGPTGHAATRRAPPKPKARKRPPAGDRPEPGATIRAAASSDEEIRWLNEQLDGDMEDVTFLPPYASGIEEERPGEGGQASAWTPPEPAKPPGPEAGQESAQAVETSRDVPIPRHFALGTVAIIRDLMAPGEVAQILLEQRRRPRKQFGELAVQMGFLTAEQLRTLLQAQQEGLFTDEEIREARHRLRTFREMDPPA